MRQTNYRSIQRQQGMSYIVMLVVLSVSIFVGLFALKVGPHYFENWTVEAVAAELAERPDVLKQSRSKIYQHINQAYRTNNLWDLEAEDTVSLKRDAERGYIVTVAYERRTTLFHNIDVVTKFNSSPNGDVVTE